MCSGSVDISFVLSALSRGADGVFIGGCHLNDCHYNTHGNYHAVNMVSLFKKIMEHLGLNPARLRLESVSAGEGIRFAEIMNDFAMKVKDLGPLGSGEGIDKNVLKLKLKAITQMVPYIRVLLNERLGVRFKTVKEYNEFYASEEFAGIFRETIADKLAITQIISLLREGPLATGEISKILGLTPSDTSRYLNSSAWQGLVRYEVSHKRYALA